MKNKIILLIPILIIFLFTSCKQNLVNPNAASDKQVLSTREGIIALSIGIRQNYSTNVLASTMVTPSVTAREVKGVATFFNVIEIEQGGTDLPASNVNVSNYWAAMQREMSMCESLIQNAPNVTGIDAGTLSGVMAQAYLFKAMTLANLAMAYQQADINSDQKVPVTFVPRDQVLSEAIRLLNLAVNNIKSNPPTTSFNSSVLGPNFDLVNSIYAMEARINLIAGRYDSALYNANLVDLGKVSQFVYSTLSPNPLYNLYIIAPSYFPRIHFGLPDSLYYKGDNRLNFYFGNNIQIIEGDTITSMLGFASSQTTAIPVYTPDEIRLIRAESILRTGGSLNDALSLINYVRTQTAGDPFGVNAGLPPYSGAVTTQDLLEEVYKQRCAELYLSGLKWEDTRRFNRPAPPTFNSERNRIFYPYPQAERIVNPNTPGDPSI